MFFSKNAENLAPVGLVNGKHTKRRMHGSWTVSSQALGHCTNENNNQAWILSLAISERKADGWTKSGLEIDASPTTEKTDKPANGPQGASSGRVAERFIPQNQIPSSHPVPTKSMTIYPDPACTATITTSFARRQVWAQWIEVVFASKAISTFGT